MNDIAAKPRFQGLDVLRGLALLGVFVINIPHMGAGFMQIAPEAPQSLTSLDWQVFLLTNIGLEGAARGLFCLLFGAGAVLLTRRLEAIDKSHASRLYARRQGLLIVFGLVNGLVFLWPGDILFTYGLSALAVIVWIRHWSAQALFLFSTVLLSLLSAFMTLGAAFLAAAAPYDALAQIAQDMGAPRLPPSPLGEDGAAWLMPDRDQEAVARLGGYAQNWGFQFGLWRDLQADWVQIFMVWESAATMALGVGLMRAGVFTGQAPRAVLWRLMIAGYAVALALRIPAYMQGWTTEYGDLWWAGNAIYQPARIAMTLGHLGAILLLVDAVGRNPVIGAFAAYGRMALTHYLSQSVIAALIFSGFGLGLFGSLDIAALTLLAVVIVAAQIAVSPFWLARFGAGPMEQLWRHLAGQPAKS